MNLKSRFFFSLLILAACCLPAAMLYAQPSANARVDARKITIGDHLRLWLEVKPGAKDNTVRWAKPDSMQGLEIVEQGKIDTIKNADTYLLKQRLLVTGFDSGQYYIPPFAFKVIDKAGQVTDLHTDSILIQVATIPVDTTKAFKPIKDIVEVQSSWLDYWKLILAGILLVALLVFVWFYFYKNRKTKIPEGAAKVPPEKAHEKALRQLQELKDQHLPEQGKVKEYYSGLSDIIRTYLEERYGITAMEQTTDELLSMLKKQTESRAELRKVRPELKMILRTADLAKFAKANPLPDEQHACMMAALEVIKRTQLKPEEGAS